MPDIDPDIMQPGPGVLAHNGISWLHDAALFRTWACTRAFAWTQAGLEHLQLLLPLLLHVSSMLLAKQVKLCVPHARACVPLRAGRGADWDRMFG